jgi:hypothetical protein
MYPRIPRELVADPLGSVQHILGPTALDDLPIVLNGIAVDDRQAEIFWSF